MFIFLLICGTLLTGTVVAAVLPRLVVYARSGGYVCRDRGIRKVNTPEGSVIVCEPAPQYRHALRQFVLGRVGRETVFIGRWAEHVRYAEYDLYVYDRRGKAMKVLSVRELPQGGKGGKIALPQDTGFVSPALRAIDASPRTSRPQLQPFFRSLYIVLFLTGMLFLQTLFFEIGFSHLLEEGAYYLPAGSAGFLFAMLFLSAATLAVTAFSLFGARALLARLLGGKQRSVRGAMPHYPKVRSLVTKIYFALSNLFSGLKTSRFVLACKQKCRQLLTSCRGRFSALFARLKGKGGKKDEAPDKKSEKEDKKDKKDKNDGEGAA